MIKDSQCKKCRRFGQKLFLKGERCFSQKCAMIKRPSLITPRGRKRRRMVSEYGRQLFEKQKIKFTYGISERQFKNYFKEIAIQKGNKEELLVRKLENRLDNVIFRLGWANSRKLARQIVSHGHTLVNGRKVTVPSYQVKEGDLVKLKEKSKKSPLFQNLKVTLKKQEIPAWLSLDKAKLEAKVTSQPKIEALGKIAEIPMLIEYYSR